MIKFFNGYYFMYIIIAIFLFFILYISLKNCKQETQRKVLTIILFLNLVLHFSKLCFEPYRSGLPGTIRKVTFENICAVSTLIFPFIYLIKKKDSYILNYMFFIGICGGVGALTVPTEALGKEAFSFDIIRFYTCHFVLVAVPVLSALFGIIEPSYKKIWSIPLFFLAIECLILVNELVLIKVGFVESSWAEFFDPDVRNSSFIFGPLSTFKPYCGFIDIFVPSIFKKNIFGIIDGADFYWPVIWMIIPAFIYLPPFSAFLILLFKCLKKALSYIPGISYHKKEENVLN